MSTAGAATKAVTGTQILPPVGASTVEETEETETEEVAGWPSCTCKEGGQEGRQTRRVGKQEKGTVGEAVRGGKAGRWYVDGEAGNIGTMRQQRRPETNRRSK